jgi:S-formylglutathione hydrolase FrmB
VKYIIGFCFLWVSLQLFAQVDTVAIYSKAMQQYRKAVVIKPYHRDIDSIQYYPVVYLLHGYGGNYANWIVKVSKLQQLASRYKLFIVCPDGNTNSWYLNSPIDSSYRYETYIASEVPAFIDSVYKTIPKREKRAITGLSMGGHGALLIAWKHAHFFGACGSMSGAVDLNASKNKYEISKRIGDTSQFATNWFSYSVIGIIERTINQHLAIMIDCGTEDYFLSSNRLLHQKLMQLNKQHDYIERPGAHNWEYWANAIEYQLLFFSHYFSKAHY